MHEDFLLKKDALVKGYCFFRCEKGICTNCKEMFFLLSPSSKMQYPKKGNPRKDYLRKDKKTYPVSFRETTPYLLP